MNTMNLKSSPFNVWDDYYDEESAPKGEIYGVTHGYIEEFDELTEEQKSEISALILDNLKRLDLPGVILEKMIDNDIRFTHLSHERRERLIEELEGLNLKYQGVPIDFYSES